MTDPSRPRKRSLDDDVLMAAYRQTSAADRGPHLTEDQWEQLSCGEMDEDARGHAMAHIVSCQECTAIHRSLIALSAEAPQFDPAVTPPPAHASSWRPWWSYALGLAAAAGIVVAVFVNRPAPVPADDHVVRSASASTAVDVVSPSSGTRLTERRFSWQAVATADTYEIRVNAADGGLVWTGTTRTTSIELPASIAPAAGRYFWQVSALKEGVAIGTSPIVAFQIE